MENKKNAVQNKIEIFRVIGFNLAAIAGIMPFPETDMEKIAISLYDHWLENNLENVPNLEIYGKVGIDSDSDLKLKYGLAALNVLDPEQKITPLIMEHTMESEQDFEIILTEFLPKSRLSGPLASLYRIIIICILGLGKSFAQAGNDKLGIHLLTSASTIQERVNRTSSRIITDELVSRVIYSNIAQLGLKLSDYELAIEFGTKLVSRWDLVIFQVEGYFDLAGYFSTLMLLAAAGEQSSDYQSAVYAYTKAIELLNSEKKLALDGKSILEYIEIPKHIAELEDCLEIAQQNFCLALITANEKGNGDPSISLNYARSALEYFEISLRHCGAKSNKFSEVDLKFILGRMAYKMALSLSGPSSPPVAVLAPELNTPKIKSLLEESLMILEDIASLAKPGRLDNNCQEAVLLQTAIIALDLRQEEKAQRILKEQDVFHSTLVIWGDSRQSGTEMKRHGHLSNVVYSAGVFKRLLNSSNPSLSKGLLTLRRTQSRKGSAKVQCSYCSMQSVSDVKCKSCADVNILVWYCSEDCRSDHYAQHQAECKTDSATAERGVMDLSGLQQGLYDTLAESMSLGASGVALGVEIGSTYLKEYRG